MQEGLLWFDANPKHDLAEKVARAMDVTQHLITRVDLKSVGGSALTADMDVPKARSESEMAASIPITYVPARNTIFLSFALGWAEVLDADAFAAFKEKGLFDQETAQSFRKNILERGGTADAMDLWKAFRGREPDVEPLLKRRGLK